MYTKNDIRVCRQKPQHTHLQNWVDYWFVTSDGQRSLCIESQDGVFKFYARHCTTLDEAKAYIAEFLNQGHSIFAL